MVREGVDFVSPCQKKKKNQKKGRKEGRKKKNPCLVSIRGNYPTCKKYGGHPVGVCKVTEGCLKCGLKLSGWCVEGVWVVYVGCQDGIRMMSIDVWNVSLGCENGGFCV